jgi:hypothetical protein
MVQVVAASSAVNHKIVSADLGELLAGAQVGEWQWWVGASCDQQVLPQGAAGRAEGHGLVNDGRFDDVMVVEHERGIHPKIAKRVEE